MRGVRWPFILAFLWALSMAVLCRASCPLLVHSDPDDEREFQNVCQTIANPSIQNAVISSATVTNLRGVTNGSNATAGSIGEYISSTSAQINLPGSSTQWGDIASISLTPGDWQVTVQGFSNPNGATVTGEVDLGIGTSSGNVSPGAIAVDWTPNIMMILNDSTGIFFTKRMSISGSTTAYAKIRTTYSGGTPVVQASIFARRVR
jgi:hypothetical protein